MSLIQQLEQAAHFIQAHPHFQLPKGLVILGSGLGAFADTLQNAKAIDYAEIPHFGKSGVQGHAGRLVFGEFQPGFPIACMQGRFHYYEGHSLETVVFPVRLLRQLGAEFLIVTNAAGGVNQAFSAGTLMLITDHLNLVGLNPLLGPNEERLGPRFLDMSEAYDLRLRELAMAVAGEHKIPLQQGVYAGLSGPVYETPAEVRMLRTLGADAVGMSTVPEVIAANHVGLKVLGLSCITNAAAGILPQKLSHQEVMETAAQTQQQFMDLLSGVLRKVASQTLPNSAQMQVFSS